MKGEGVFIDFPLDLESSHLLNGQWRFFLSDGVQYVSRTFYDIFTRKYLDIYNELSRFYYVQKLFLNGLEVSGYL